MEDLGYLPALQTSGWDVSEFHTTNQETPLESSRSGSSNWNTNWGNVTNNTNSNPNSCYNTIVAYMTCRWMYMLLPRNSVSFIDFSPGSRSRQTRVVPTEATEVQVEPLEMEMYQKQNQGEVAYSCSSL